MSRGAFVSLAVLLLAAPVAATTYVLPPDAALVRQAAVVAQGTVVAVEPAPVLEPPSTDVFLQVERVLKGFVAGGTVIVRVPGGIGPDGIGLRIWGAPGFREGERVLLFLEPRRDGTYGVLHLMLGAFYERERRGRRLAMRDLAEAVEVSLIEDGETLEELEPARDFQGFADWIAAIAGGDRPPAEYLLEPETRGARTARHSPLIEDHCTGLNLRWFHLDREDSLEFRLDSSVAEAASGRRAFDRARRAWSESTRGRIRFDRSRRGPADPGIGLFDGVNSLAFGDPAELTAGSFRCGSGGIVSIAALWFENGRGQSCERVGAGRKGDYRGRTYLEILGADLVTNQGAACLFKADAAAGARVMAHELGHALGLAHGAEPTELMWGEVREPAAGNTASQAVDASAAQRARKLYHRPRR